jgi:tetratricopeptide (TPR) repeat protein
MPSHIFTRLGLWQDSIDSNLASAASAREHAATASTGVTGQDELHALDYLEYAYLQTGRDGEAKHVLDQAEAVAKLDQTVFQAAYALSAIPARYTLERRHWRDAAGLNLRPDWFPWRQFPFAEAITRVARALGAARSGDPAAARSEVEQLSALHKTMSATQQDYDWATQIEVQRLAASAWLAHAEKRDTDALRDMRAAADTEDRTEKSPVTPGSVLPARELLGDLLAELNRPAQALLEYEASLKIAPRRFNSIYGAARAAELSGDRTKATARYRELLELCSPGGSARPELQTARAFLK